MTLGTVIIDTFSIARSAHCALLRLNRYIADIKLRLFRNLSRLLKTSPTTVQVVRTEYAKSGLDSAIFPKGTLSYDRRAIMDDDKRKIIVEMIPGFVQPEVMLYRAHIDKPHVVIAVRGRKTPGTAAGLYAVKNPDALL